MEKNCYPRLLCDLSLLLQNVKAVTTRCHALGIQVTGVTKGIHSRLPIVRQFVSGGCDQLASSRLEQLKALREAGLGLPTMLIRVPMMSELEEVPRCCDYSLHSDLSVLEALEEVCARQNVTHKVILMADLGDLREGWWDQEEFLAAALRVERALPHLELAGIGTNLGCYGSIVPTVEKMETLAALAQRVEEAIGRALELVSGGATSSFPLVHQKTMPKKINHLRMGEGILLCYDLQKLWGIRGLDDISNHVFTLQTQVLECRSKPSCPVGKLFLDAFGHAPVYEDRGIRKRALLGLGKLDVGDIGDLIPRDEGVLVLGGSSDHTILDVEDCPRAIKAGDLMEFDLNYPTMLFLTARDVFPIEYLGG